MFMSFFDKDARNGQTNILIVPFNTSLLILTTRYTNNGLVTWHSNYNTFHDNFITYWITNIIAHFLDGGISIDKPSGAMFGNYGWGTSGATSVWGGHGVKTKDTKPKE